MTQVLVTGGTGFLGAHLLDQLADASGDSLALRVLTRSPVAVESDRKLGGPEIEWIEGSLGDYAAVERALQGVDQIYHLAGEVSFAASAAPGMYALHVSGTRNLFGAAEAMARPIRIVMASTSGTTAVSDDPAARPDESSPPPLSLISHWPYYASKYYQEQVAAEFSRRRSAGHSALDIVTVKPSLLLGPGDRRLSSTIDVLRFLQRNIPFVPSGGLNFVDVRDAASALIAAMVHGTTGESYLVGGVNWSLAEFFGRLERLTKIPAPKVRLPRRLAYLGAQAAELWSRAFDGTPNIEAVRVEMAGYYWYFDGSKARRELGCAARDPAETLFATISDLRASHFA